LRWSPDNSKLAFYDCGDQTKLAPSVWVINRDGTNLHLIYQFNIPLWDLKIAWSPDGQSVGVWYQIKENDNVNGLLLDAAGVASPKSIEWNIPVWWTPPFWPQWGR
jgi:Tol biopolymer transport system component